MKEYKIGQIFKNSYPAEAAEWCNENNCYIEEIEAEEDTRQFEIFKIPPETDEERQKRIAGLSLTKREVFLALYKDKGITPEQVKANIKDPEALIEFEYANEYFRGNPLINTIGQKLGYTDTDLDYLFANGELPA